MARAGHLLSTALSLQETADLVVQLVVPELADWCFVELVQPDGSIERTALAHRDPAKLRWAQEISRRYPLDPASPAGSPKVIRTGEPELIEEVPDELLVQVAVDDEHLGLLRAIGFVSVCIVPLVARGRVIGDLVLATGPDGSGPPRRLGAETLLVARALAERCALALDNAALYAQRDLVAVSLQEELLPRELPAVPDLDVAARYSAAGEGNDVGGDFYDLFASGGGWQLVVGDVVGKGPVAAAVTGLARHTLRAAAAYEQRPAQLLRGLNRALLAEDPGRRLATVACVRLDAADGALALTVGVGGHPLPLLVSADGTVREVGAYGTILGVHESVEIRDVPARLEPGELLVLYTDGVIDARGPGGLFGEERLHGLLTGLVGEAPSRVVHRIESAVLAHSGGRPRDDVAIVALRLRS
jgi:serine phosphatase RsbU (regulator of sigma subunit)